MLDGISFINTPFDILVLGKPGNGKTTLVKKYVLGDVSSVGYDSSNCIVLKNVHSSRAANQPQLQAAILDSSSSPESFLTSNLYQVRNARTMLFTYATDCQESFELLEYTINCIMSLRDTLPPCVVACLKSDLSYASSVLYSQGKDLADSVGALGFFEVSALKDSSVNDVFEPLVQAALKIQQSEATHDRDSLGSPKSGFPLNDVFSNTVRHIQSPVSPPSKALSSSSRMPSMDLSGETAPLDTAEKDPGATEGDPGSSEKPPADSSAIPPLAVGTVSSKGSEEILITRSSQSKRKSEPGSKKRSGCCTIV